MNSLAERFSTSSALAKLRKTREFAEDEEISDVMWGSTAGFGNLAKGAPSFYLPDVPDVRAIKHFHSHYLLMIFYVACWFPQITYG